MGTLPHSAALLRGLQNTFKTRSTELDLAGGDPCLPAVGLPLTRVQAQLAIADVPFAFRRFSQVVGLVSPVPHVLLGPMHAVGNLHPGQARPDLRILQLAERIRRMPLREESECENWR